MLDLFDAPASPRTYTVRWPAASRNDPFITPHVSTFDAYVKTVRAAGLRVAFSSPFLASVEPLSLLDFGGASRCETGRRPPEGQGRMSAGEPISEARSAKPPRFPVFDCLAQPCK